MRIPFAAFCSVIAIIGSLALGFLGASAWLSILGGGTLWLISNVMWRWENIVALSQINAGQTFTLLFKSLITYTFLSGILYLIGLGVGILFK